MVLVSLALVVAAAITLVVGLLQSGLTLIYASIACSVLAGLVLAVAVLRGRPDEEAPPRAAAPSPAPSATASATTSSAPPWQSGPEPSGAGTAPWSPPAREPAPAAQAQLEPEDEPVGAVLGGVLGSRPFGRASDRTQQFDPPSYDDDDDGFPIPNYDELRSSEVMAALADLSGPELEQVREREAAGMNRFTVLSKVDALLAADDGDGEGDGEGDEGDWDIRDTEWSSPARPGDDDFDDDFEDEDEDEPVVAPPPRRAPARRSPPVTKAPARKAPARKAPARKAPARTAPARTAAAAKAAPAAKKAV
ncbi:MAG: hypothetical protein AB1673_15895, partial [Actinomycetota bacterium]